MTCNRVLDDVEHRRNEVAMIPSRYCRKREVKPITDRDISPRWTAPRERRSAGPSHADRQ
jgi:hypothetical protein